MSLISFAVNCDTIHYYKTLNNTSIRQNDICTLIYTYSTVISNIPYVLSCCFRRGMVKSAVRKCFIFEEKGTFLA